MKYILHPETLCGYLHVKHNRGIYVLRCDKPTGEVLFYVGQSEDVLKRQMSYAKLSDQNVGQKKLYAHLKKYLPSGCFSIVEIVYLDASDDLDKMEDEYMKKYNSLDRHCGLNLQDPYARKTNESKERRTKLNKEKQEEIVSLYNNALNGVNLKFLAKKYGVGESTIHRVLKKSRAALAA